jgi:hypothetical protein
MKYFLGLAFLALCALGLLGAANSSASTLGAPSGASPSPASANTKSAADTTPQGPTVIDSTEGMDYDETNRVAIFIGEDYGVYVNDPMFIVYCDKLTAHLKKNAGTAQPTPGAPGAKAPSPTPQGDASAADPANSRTSALERALAEGTTDRPVVIVQDKPASNGQEAQHNVGIALKADYNAETGDVYMTGWPRGSQGKDTMIATSPKTVIIMNMKGKRMRAIGPTRTVIEPDDQPKTTGASSPAQSPGPSPQ